ncbi:MAG TPA: NAD(P)/FAD-dependent oxidoreductase [Candidatus Acidoferrales bacterium]|nr:NAD(P)/FAD-dependent oxidoreductase [Candidatus Acidoferrales bacterium]
MIFDVAIVGAGPSGSVAAINLARAGVRVLLLDKAVFPRVKPCGGGISTRTFKHFTYLADVFKTVPTRWITRVVFASPDGNQVEICDKNPYYAMVRRIEFDAALVAEARRLGAEFREGCCVQDLRYDANSVSLLLADGEEVGARMVIAADGVNSRIALRSGLRGPWRPDQVALDTTEESPLSQISCDLDSIYVNFGAGTGFGYYYVFPKAEHVNLGIGFLVEFYRNNVQKHPHDLHGELVEELNREGIVNGSSATENLKSAHIPMVGPVARLSRERTLLTGDAGGFVNGFSAEGIYYAMRSGELAARTAIAAYQRQDFSAAFLRRYDRAVNSSIGRELRTSVMVGRRLLTSPTRINKVVAAAKRDPIAAHLLADFASGRISYGELKLRMALHGFFFALGSAAGMVERVFDRWC